MYKFRNLNSSHSSFDDYRTQLQTYFSSYMSIASCVPAVLFLFINAVISKRVSHKIRLIGSLIGMIILFILTTTLTKIDTDQWQITFFACSSIFQGAVMGLAACFPSRYMQANMNGQAIGGVFAITYYRYYLYQMKELENEAECRDIIQGVNKSYFWATFKAICCDGYVGSITFFTTLAVYPSIAVLVVSVNFGNKTALTNQFFIPVACFLLFNLGDLTGRIVSGMLRLPKSGSCWLPFLATARLILIPMLMMCNISKPNRHLAVMFNDDVIFVVLNLVLGLSNGYLMNLVAIYAPKRVQPQQREMAGSMMAFFFGIGLASGALVSDLLVSLL
uniref:Uncharacterized protein n=1 Tax=Strigamia maritima TaxID=126957 RepID=T1IPQ8_STRMM